MKNVVLPYMIINGPRVESTPTLIASASASTVPTATGVPARKTGLGGGSLWTPPARYVAPAEPGQPPSSERDGVGEAIRPLEASGCP